MADDDKAEAVVVASLPSPPATEDDLPPAAGRSIGSRARAASPTAHAGDVDTEAKAAPADVKLPLMSREDVAGVADMDRMLIILDDLVYDLTAYADRHPGGSSVLMTYVGRDATSDFESIGHSNVALRIRHQYVVARLRR